MYPINFSSLGRYLLIVITFSVSLLIAGNENAEAQGKQNRLALVIGNSIYVNPGDALPGAAKDAKSVAAALEKQGFLVRTETNLTRQNIMAAVQQFKSSLRVAGRNTIGFLYYAGHGGADSENRDNFLLPVEAEVKNMTVSGVSVRWLQQELQELSGNHDSPVAVVVIIDACRTLARFGNTRGADIVQNAVATPSVSAMTNVVEPAQGFLFAFSTSSNQSASDEGVFAQELTRQLARSGLTIPGVFEEVQREVYRKTGQFPVYQPMIAAQVCLISCELEIKGPFARNELLLTQTKEDAAASMRRIEQMGASTHCQKGWQATQALFASAETQMKRGSFDTAGETFRAVSERTVAIESYLTTMKLIAGFGNTQRAPPISEDAIKHRQRQMYENPYKQLFLDKIGYLRNHERIVRRPINWTKIRQIQSEMEAFEAQGNYVNATERAIEGHNVGTKMLEDYTGAYIGQPIPKEDRLRTFRQMSDVPLLTAGMPSSPMIQIDSSPAARACKG